MRTSKSIIALGSAIVIVLVCIIAVGLIAYNFIVDVITSPLASSITNAYEHAGDLQQAIESAYPAESIFIRGNREPTLGSRSLAQPLIITLVNSAANQLSADEQRAQAYSIAPLVLQRSASSSSRIVMITFIKRTRFLGIPLCSAKTFRFTRAELLQDYYQGR